MIKLLFSSLTLIFFAVLQAPVWRTTSLRKCDLNTVFSSEGCSVQTQASEYINYITVIFSDGHPQQPHLWVSGHEESFFVDPEAKEKELTLVSFPCLNGNFQDVLKQFCGESVQASLAQATTDALVARGYFSDRPEQFFNFAYVTAVLDQPTGITGTAPVPYYLYNLWYNTPPSEAVSYLFFFRVKWGVRLEDMMQMRMEAPNKKSWSMIHHRGILLPLLGWNPKALISASGTEQFSDS